MRVYLRALCIVASLLGITRVTAQQTKAGEYKRQIDGRAYAELASTPAKERAKSNPLAKDPDAVAAGMKLFEQHCTECHGDTGAGTRRGPSLLEPAVQRAAPGAIFWVLTNGVVRHGMPVWSKLPEPQRWQLVSYIKSLDTPMKEAQPRSQVKP